MFFDKDSLDDKRIVLKKFLEKNIKNKVIILEDNFGFKEDDNTILLYKDIGLRNLCEIESLTAFLSDCIFIIHESLSTATELGVFASNEELRKRICLLVPDELSVEENKLSGFIKLAFTNRGSVKTIKFFPETYINRISFNTASYHSKFKNNEIGKFLGGNINKFINKVVSNQINNKIIRNNYCKPKRENTAYWINKQSKQCVIFIDGMNMKYQIMAVFSLAEFRREFREQEALVDAISLVQNYYESILINTVSSKEGEELENYKIEFKICNLSNDNLKLRTAIAYILYLLHAMKCIEIPNRDVKQKLIIGRAFTPIYTELAQLINSTNDFDMEELYAE